MTKKSLPTPEQLRELLTYDPEAGKLFWKPRPVEMFPAEMYAKTWNTKNAGKEAFTANNGFGYRVGSLAGLTLRAHRVIWAMVYGAWPDDEIDHENCDPSDNRIGNLRPSTSQQNKWNQRLKRTNSCGLKGASWSKKERVWVAQIHRGGKQTRIGTYNTAIEAHNAYVREASAFRGEYGRMA